MAERSVLEDTCAVCGRTFEMSLEDGTAEEWTAFWSLLDIARVEAEACGDDCADEYERSRIRW